VEAQKITLNFGGMSSSTCPRIRREDVSAAKNISAEVGFELALPCVWDTVRESQPPSLLVTRFDGSSIRLVLDSYNVNALLLEHGLGYTLALARSAPAAAMWILTKRATYKAELKRALGLARRAPSIQRMDAMQLVRERTDLPFRKTFHSDAVSIIIPVYNAFDILPNVLQRIIDNTEIRYNLIIIEDSSTDARVRPFLRDWCALIDRQNHELLQSVTLLENASNVGFVKSINKGLSAYRTMSTHGPVVLLNSDAFVPAEWLGRLVLPLYLDSTIASVTPMSNDAEIFSVPEICERRDLEEGWIDILDQVAKDVISDEAWVDAPTGVGFCMAMSRSWVEKLPTFDTIFGKGYGEEVNWCQSVKALGGRNVGLPNLFVEHRGGMSFGSKEKVERIRKNNAVILARFPRYDSEVQSFITSDPLSLTRVALYIGLIGRVSNRRISVYFAHSLGGGAEDYLSRRIRKEIDTGGGAVVLRVGGEAKWEVEVHGSLGVASGLTDDFDVVVKLVQILKTSHIVYSCGVGYPTPYELPGLMSRIKRGDDTSELLFHDYFPLSPSYTLLDSDGVYRGLPGASTNDSAHTTKDSEGNSASVQIWQRAWYEFAKEADDIVVFSENSAQHVKSVWPDLSGLVRIIPHILEVRPNPFRQISRDRQVIGILGNIGLQKGALVIRDLARINLQRGRPFDIVLVGNIDPAFILPSDVVVTGSYSVSDISHIIENHKITHWFIPSIWPETFSYTTHEALATGLPVFSFNLGAQGDAVREARNGIALELIEAGSLHDTFVEIFGRELCLDPDEPTEVKLLI